MKYIDVITKKYDHYLLVGVVLLCVIGTVMLFSASNSISLDQSQRATATIYLQAHLKRLLVGVFVMFAVMMFDYRNLKNISKYLLIGSIALLFITKISYWIQGNNSPARWLYIGGFSIQTSDIARLSIIIYLATFIDHFREKIKDFYNGFAILIGILAFTMGLIVIQPDFSTAAMIGLIGFMMLFIGGAKISHLIATGAVSLMVLVPIMLMKPYRLQRVLTFFYGESAGVQESYQIKQSLISLGNGGFLGLGLGNSLGKNLFLPTPHTDFIFAIIGEELGLLGTVFILSTFVFIFQRGIKIAKESTDTFGILLATGISFNFILYGFINAAVVTGVVPTTGLPMPFISYGGSGLLINLVSMGILLNISQAKRSLIHKSGWSPRVYG
ncbi:MAG: FtsW/RodA/SpoVE family cell cycle protein [Candidatus Neomarinimicrobiota bacterium]|nr:FtsW/RodA/SpoVE family cell cycle protein [Candidatus Neomarinimicrobiota bacterium]